MPSPYSGNPTNFPQDIDILSGGDLPNTTNFNTAYEGLADRTAALNSQAIANAAVTWKTLTNVNPEQSVFGSIIWCGCWDPFNEQWLTGTSTALGGVACFYNYSYDGHNWGVVLPTLSNPYFPIAMAVEPITGIIASIRTDFTVHWTITVQLQGLPAVEETPTGAGSFLPGQGVMCYFYATTNASLKQWMFVGGSGVTGHSPWTGMSVQGVGVGGSGAWTNNQSHLPTNWITGTNSVFQWLYAIDESFPMAGDGNNIVFVQCGARPGIDHSYLLQWNQSAPTTFTDITPALLSGTTYQIRGFAYSAQDQLWGMVIVDGDLAGHGAFPATTYFLTSPDLVTWNVVYTFVDFYAGGLAVAGNIWSIPVYNSFFGSESDRVLVSFNVSLGINQTWASADFMDKPSMGALASSGYAGKIFRSNGHQFFMATLLGGTPLGPTYQADAGTSNASYNGFV